MRHTTSRERVGSHLGGLALADDEVLVLDAGLRSEYNDMRIVYDRLHCGHGTAQGAYGGKPPKYLRARVGIHCAFTSGSVINPLNSSSLKAPS